METPSEKEVILLGIIAEEPVHAYGLEEKIRERDMEDWTSISKSSIYRLLQSLEERHLIAGRLEHEGQGATRKVFTLTGSGIAALAAGVLALLGTTERAKSRFLVGLGFSYFAPRAAVIEQLRTRRQAFLDAEKHLTGIRASVDAELHGDESVLEYGVDTVYQLFFDYLIERTQLESRFLARAADELARARHSQLKPDATEPG